MPCVIGVLNNKHGCSYILDTVFVELIHCEGIWTLLIITKFVNNNLM